MSEVRFALKKHAEPFAGASTTVRDGELYDVGRALKEGDGVIVVSDDQTLVDALNGLDVLKQVGPAGLEEAKADYAAATADTPAAPADPDPVLVVASGEPENPIKPAARSGVKEA